MAQPPPTNTLPPDYGIDAPGVVRNLFTVTAVGLTLFGTAKAGLWSGVFAHVDFAFTGLSAGLTCGAMGAWMLYDSKIGKLREREALLDHLTWRGDEAVLDVGCGRGLMLIGAATRLKSGVATGVDLWQAEDLSGNRPEATLENARREGVAERVQVATGDMRKLPFEDASFDRIVSNAAIHTVYEAEGRAQVVRELARVLRPGGEVVIHDIRHVEQLAAGFTEAGLEVKLLGSRVFQGFLALVTLGSLRPNVLVARKR